MKRDGSEPYTHLNQNSPVHSRPPAQAASYINDTLSCSDFLYKGLCFGLPIQTIAGNPHLRYCFQTMDQQTVDSCWNTSRQRIDQTARARMLAISRYDQSLIHSLPIGEIYDNSAGNSRLKSKYQPVWDSLLQEVVTLTRANGFPAQKVHHPGLQTRCIHLFRPTIHYRPPKLFPLILDSDFSFYALWHI